MVFNSEWMEDQIQQIWNHLLANLREFISDEDKQTLDRAFLASRELCGDRLLADGKPCIYHHLEVARIAVEES